MTNDSCIPLSGTNDITGTGFFKSTSDSQLQIGSGTSTTTGGCFVAYGSEYSNTELAGSFRLRARTTTNYDLLGKSDGTLTWGNKNLAMQEDYIPRSGGAVISGVELSRTADDSKLVFDGGTTGSNGASIELYGKNHSLFGGWTVIKPQDGNGYYQMILKPDGTATWGNKNLAMQEDYIPRSGGAVIAINTTIGCVNNNGYLRICGGVNNNFGGAIQLNGKDTAGNKGFAFISSTNGTNTSEIIVRHDGETVLGGCTVFYSNQDNTTSLGFNNYRWKSIYAATSAINTSDSRLKNTISSIDDKLLDAWETIQPKQYKFNDATESKGESARFHTGYLAQDIEKACTDNNIDATRYGLFCYDSWEEEPEITEDVEVENDGIKTTEKRIVQSKKEKGDIYALRYEEALVVECAYLRREINRLKDEIRQLKPK